MSDAERSNLLKSLYSVERLTQGELLLGLRSARAHVEEMEGELYRRKLAARVEDGRDRTGVDK